jgi:hypothetical protein
VLFWADEDSPMSWPLRRWAAAGASSVVFAALVAIPTDLIDTPLFSRDIPPTWWAWPALAVSSLLAGLLIATYVAVPEAARDDRSSRRGGYVGGLLTFFAVGCPVCNKLVLVALGSAGALTWFQPVQPLLQLAAIAVLAWALWRRLRGERACELPAPNTGGAGP